MIKLSHRLTAILSEINGEKCADIGCDHGKLIVKALKDNIIEYGYAIDISPMSLQKAATIGREEGVSSRLTLLCGDGASVLPEKVDVAVIAGMGANETVKILSYADFAKKYVLSPHQDAHILRKYLSENEYFVRKDYIIFDKKYYPIIVAEKGKSNYTPDELYFGKNTPSTDAYEKFLSIRHSALSKVMDKIGEKANVDTLNEWREAEKCYKKK